ncbi:TPA: tetratricopeptide repeat protein [Providencia rettgeri]
MRLLFALFILITSLGVANAQDIESIEQDAMNGNAQQQAELGIKYRDGDGVEKDINKSIMWFEKSAAQGNVVATMSLGIIYGGGQLGVPKDSAKAIRYYMPVAKMGNDIYPFNLMAQRYLAMSYEDLGDKNNALLWYKKAAEDDGQIGKSSQKAIDRLLKE